MASLDEFNPGRWEAEDEDFLDREGNYVLQKSTNTLVTNVTAKTRRSRPSHAQRINDKTTASTFKMNKPSSGKREPPSFALARSLRKTVSSKSSNRAVPSIAAKRSPRQTTDNRVRPTPTKQTSAPIRSSSAPPKLKSLQKEKSAPVVSKHLKTAPKQQSSSSNKTRLPGLLGLASVSEDERSDDEESLDIKQIFPVLDESPKPPDPNDRHWKSQQIYIPVKQEKWNEASVMRLHQSMMHMRKHVVESPYMKDPGEFEDDDKSLKIEEVFPVLAGTTPKPVEQPKPPDRSSILQAAQNAAASKRRTGQEQTTTAAAAKPPPQPPAAAAARELPPKPPPPVRPPPAPAAKVAPMLEEKAHKSQDTSSSNDGKKGYQLPTYVRRPSIGNEDLHASDDLTMDSAPLKSNSNQNLKEHGETKKVKEQQEEEELRAAEAARLERKKSKKLKKEKSKSHRKHKKKSKRRLEGEDDKSVDSRSKQRDRGSLGPESIMENEAAERERRRLKKERKEKKKRKKKKHKKVTQSDRHLSTQEPTARLARLSNSMPNIEESQSSSPDGTPPKGPSESQPVVSSKPALDKYLGEREGKSVSRRGSRRSLQSTSSKSSRKSDSKRSTKSDGHIARAKSLRPRDDGDDDVGLAAYLRDGKEASIPSSSKMSVRSDSHTTVKKSNVVKTKDPSTLQSATNPRIPNEEPKVNHHTFMKSAAAGILYESEDSLSPGGAAAVRTRIRSDRAESRRLANPTSDLGASGRNLAIKPETPRKEPFDKNVSSTWQQSTSSSPSRDPLKSNASIRQQKKGVSKPSRISSQRLGIPSTRSDLMDNDRMDSVGNFDMVSAVDAAVAAKKQEAGKLPAKKKKKSIIQRLFARRNKKSEAAKMDRSAPLVTRSVGALPQSKDQDELNEYLSSSKSTWYENAQDEKREHHSTPSSPVLDLPQDGAFKYSLGTPPSERLSTSLPHRSGRIR